MKRLCFLLLLAFSINLFSAPPKTEVQLKKQRSELKKLEADLAKRRKQLELLKSEEKSVLSTISLLDQNLNRTQEYLNALVTNEQNIKEEIHRLGNELELLASEIHTLQTAMLQRIRILYIKGEYGKAETLYKLLIQKENPSHLAYMVHRLLTADKLKIETLKKALEEYDIKKKQEMSHLNELKKIHTKKEIEQKSLEQQISGQQTMLQSLKNDQELQQKALKEFERNQKTMLSLIKKLEEKRKRELEQAKKKKKEPQKIPDKKTPKPAITPEVAFPKCLPLEGEIISQYGFQEHPVLHIRTKNLGVEIRAQKGAKVKAAAHGTVALVSEIDGRGPSVIIEHPNGIFSVYGHLVETKVKEGDQVNNCQEIGIAGDIASLNGIKLYFQVSAGTEPLDPLEWVKN